MIEKFLKAKHWQLFLLTYGIPLIIQMLLMVYLFVNFFRAEEPNPELFFNYFKVFPFFAFFFIIFLFGWYYSVGVGLNRKLSDDLKLKVGKFKVFLFIPVVYILLFSIFVAIVLPQLLGALVTTSTAPLLMFPVHLFVMFCIFYCIYFVAKTIKTLELQRKVGFSDFAGEFFLIWLFPIGIWLIQPRVNKLYQGSENWV